MKTTLKLALPWAVFAAHGIVRWTRAYSPSHETGAYVWAVLLGAPGMALVAWPFTLVLAGAGYAAVELGAAAKKLRSTLIVLNMALAAYAVLMTEVAVSSVRQD